MKSGSPLRIDLFGQRLRTVAKIFNLKQMAQTVNFLQEHKLLAYSDLEEKAKKCTATFDERNTQIKTAEKRMAEIQVLKKHIINYAKNRNVYTDISHQVKTPLAALSIYNELLQGEAEELAEIKELPHYQRKSLTALEHWCKAYSK